jgi:hypothetical protein
LLNKNKKKKKHMRMLQRKDKYGALIGPIFFSKTIYYAEV